MRIEIAYEGRIEVFDTDRFTEAQPFSGKSMLADFTLDYEDAEKDGIWLTVHCYAANDAYRTDGEEVPEARREKGWRFQLATPKETAAIESVAMDGSAVLARLYGELVDVARMDRACSLFTGFGGSLAGRIVRLNDYLANADEALAASQVLMAEAIGITANVLERAIEAETAQEVPSNDMEGDWMKGYGDDQNNY